MQEQRPKANGKGFTVNKQSESTLEARPAALQFRDGYAAGTIYVHRVGGRIVEAYRGYSYGYAALAPALRTAPSDKARS